MCAAPQTNENTHSLTRSCETVKIHFPQRLSFKWSHREPQACASRTWSHSNRTVAAVQQPCSFAHCVCCNFLCPFRVFFSAVCEFRFFFSLLLWLSLLFCLIGDGIFSGDAVVNNYLSPLLMDFKMCNLFLLLLFSVIITFFTLSPVLPCQLLMSPHAAEITRHASFMLPLCCSTSQLHSTQSVRQSACQLNGECNVTNVGMFTRICRKYEIIDSYAA